MTHDILPIARERELVVDAGYLAAKRHIIHGLLEVDVTRPRELLRDNPGADGQPLSFTAFVIASFARAIQAHPAVHAYRDLRRRLVFHEWTLPPWSSEAGAVAMPIILRRANVRPVSDLSYEPLRPGQPARQVGRCDRPGARIPRFARLLYFRGLKLNPHWVKQAQGTAIVTSVGMFGKHAGWGIAFLMSHTLGLTVGGIGERPAVHEGAVVPRQCLSLTVSFDHDLVDGAPAARFTRTLIEILQSGAALDMA
jgi:hypothetical protein